MALTPAFWAGRRVLLTGHTGFKGGWLALWLQSLGARVHGYALPAATTPSLWEVASLSAEVPGELVDIRDAARVKETLERFRPEVVLHLAAQPLVRASYLDPAETYAVNVTGTLNLLEAVRASDSVRAVLVITTDKCYANREWAWPYRENDALGGIDPYSSSKACVELLCASYRDAFLRKAGVAIATARAGNVIGGGDWSPERLLPDALRCWDRGEPLLLRHPRATRPWQHVLEPLHGYLSLAQALVQDGDAVAEAWNFGPDADAVASVADVIEQLAALWPGQPGWSAASGSGPHEAGMLALDSSKARHRLGWRPRWSLDQALSRTLAWHHAWRSGDDMRAFTRAQIAAFQKEIQ